MAAQWDILNAHAHISLEHVAEREWFYVKWSGHINLDDVVTVARFYLELQRGRNASKLLNDKSDVTGDWEEANDWLEYEWLPQAQEIGLQFMALVVSRDLHDLVPAQNIEKRFGSTCEVRLFREVKAAEQWLNSCVGKPVF